jgi:hypothetical protein
MLRVMTRSPGRVLAAIHSPASRWSLWSDGCHQPEASLRNAWTDDSASRPTTASITSRRHTPVSAAIAAPTSGVARATATIRYRGWTKNASAVATGSAPTASSSRTTPDRR